MLFSIACVTSFLVSKLARINLVLVICNLLFLHAFVNDWPWGTFEVHFIWNNSIFKTPLFIVHYTRTTSLLKTMKFP